MNTLRIRYTKRKKPDHKNVEKIRNDFKKYWEARGK